MIDDTLTTTATTVVTHNRRLSIMTIFLASMAFLLVMTSIAAFIYITRKEKILRKFHLISVLIIILVELIVLIAVVICCITQSRSTLGQVLAALLILLSLLSLMTLIYFLLEDIIKERVEPNPCDFSPYKSYEVQEIKSISQHESPIPVSADDAATPIFTPPVLTPFPRIPTPPAPTISPSLEKPVTPPVEKSVTPLVEKIITPPPPPPPPSSSSFVQNIFSFPQASAYVVDFDKIRRDLLAAIEERTIPALEEAIQQVKDHNYFQQLKYECERALELLNRLVKIEHMKIRVLRLNQATIAELHSYAKPPDEVLTVMRATFLLLGHSEKEIQEWTQIQNLLGRLGKESVRRRCYELNPLSITVDKAHEAKDILRNYDLIRVSEISVGLAAFFSWAVTMIEEREKLLESQRTILR
ncbi:unnamed protein product [Rotaria sp. Silwood1]|nr:unnamed protein product [Rotaria sp. Silwood1]CAF3328237.1 unnamed protein product [Rotaria sp. Silwood1]CAF3336620.1 unnamed protein product [Rotaria sp. Silwood1]CAF3355926.1 unnamed protein product [Rotaria sp. Silwood1]CAF4527750.1 unnamed protein product [Rotaria sp. Silwood1]